MGMKKTESFEQVFLHTIGIGGKKVAFNAGIWCLHCGLLDLFFGAYLTVPEDVWAWGYSREEVIRELKRRFADVLHGRERNSEALEGEGGH